MLESCIDEEGYSSFVIEVTTSLLQNYKGITDRNWGIGGAIEDCLHAIGSSPRESERFVEFCEAFAQAIEGYILSADDANKTTHVILPLSSSWHRMGPGICAIIKRVATTFCGMDQTGFALIEQIGQSTGTVPIDKFEDFLGEIRCHDEDLFTRILGAQMMYQPVQVGWQLEMMSKLELATRSRVRNK
jgi:hypothetical protein